MNDKEKTQTNVEIHTNPNNPILWVDDLNIALRNDESCLLRFTANLPEGHFEQVKIMATKERIINIIDSLSKATGYYPENKNSLTPAP